LKISAIIPAAGSGRRFGEKKQLKRLKGQPLLVHTMTPFLSSEAIYEIIIVVPKGEETFFQRDLRLISEKKPIIFVSGGLRRQDSVKNGIMASNNLTDLVCIHDAARPFVTNELIEDSIFACKGFDGAVVAIQSNDTVKYSENNTIKKTIERDNIWLAQTPQTFWKKTLLKALSYADQNGFQGTDEASIMENMGCKILLIKGCSNNFKITYPEDWKRAEKILE